VKKCESCGKSLKETYYTPSEVELEMEIVNRQYPDAKFTRLRFPIDSRFNKSEDCIEFGDEVHIDGKVYVANRVATVLDEDGWQWREIRLREFG